MKYFAILKDSLRETIDSKVLFVVVGLSVLAIFIMATLSFQPNPPDTALTKIAERIPDGAEEIDLPILGRKKATPSFTEYTVEDLQGPPDSRKPWEAEYQFVLKAKDLIPGGTRAAMLKEEMRAEEARERVAQTGRKTRLRTLQEDLMAEAQRIQERERKKGSDEAETQRRLQEELTSWFLKRLEEETRSLTAKDMQKFLKTQLENQGNWTVREVKEIELPADQRRVKLKVKVPIKEGEDVRIKTQDADGEVHKFAVTVVSRDGTYNVWPHKATLLFGAVPLGSSEKPGQLVYRIFSWGVGVVGAGVIMVLSCIITAFYIPNMLRKGTIDLLLAKPIHRATLLIYKYIGGLLFVFLNTSVLIGGLWLILGLRGGIWSASYLFIILVLTFEFAFFYALSALMAVLTRSAVVSILICFVTWGVLWGLGWAYWWADCKQDPSAVQESTVATVVRVVHTAAPHYLDLDWLSDKLIQENLLSLSEGERVKMEAQGYGKLRWSESLAVTSLYIVLLLGLACWWFATRDY
ncbi:MAG TPA: ABC transporter permease subunit [Gemmataceae bacterium]|nr:ABC transporter permease subunit [Gemmataceae bacterium]